MKRIFYLSFLIPTFLFGQAPETDMGIRFEHSSFAELLEKAKKENKMIMVDAYTTWCGPCKWMTKNIFTNDTVAAYYNANFINAKIDMEKGEGIDIKKKHEVMCYPTFLFIDGAGVLRHRKSGSMEAKEFIELGINAINPSKQFAVFKSKYDSGNITSDEMGEYVLMRGRTCLSVKEEMKKYFDTQADADLIKQHNWDILYENVMNINIDSREFKYLVDHREEYDKLYKPKMPKDGSVEDVIKYAYLYALNSFVKDKNTEQYKKSKDEILKINFSFSEEVIGEADMNLYKSNSDWANYAALP